MWQLSLLWAQTSRRVEASGVRGWEGWGVSEVSEVPEPLAIQGGPVPLWAFGLLGPRFCCRTFLLAIPGELGRQVYVKGPWECHLQVVEVAAGWTSPESSYL